jgi:hypothetical protein
MPLPPARPAEVFGRVGKPLPTSFLARVPVHVVAARLGHADPAVTLRVYSHVLREHALDVGDVFALAVKAAVSKSVSKTAEQRRSD